MCRSHLGPSTRSYTRHHTACVAHRHPFTMAKATVHKKPAAAQAAASVMRKPAAAAKRTAAPMRKPAAAATGKGKGRGTGKNNAQTKEGMGKGKGKGTGKNNESCGWEVLGVGANGMALGVWKNDGFAEVWQRVR